MTSECVILESVAPEVFMKQHKNESSAQNNSRIGVNFARISLPKIGFGPLFNSLSQNYLGITSGIIKTDGYYWTHAY